MNRHAPVLADDVTIAVIIPLAHEPEIGMQLDRLAHAGIDELILVHAGDAPTVRAIDRWRDARARAPDPIVASAPCGRASQMNRGAEAATADILLFLHADTVLPIDASAHVRAAITAGRVWGRFDVRLSGTHPAFRVIERMMNWRSATTGIATGDQALFVQRDVFRMLGGYAAIPLMEDIEFAARLKWVDRPALIRAPVVTSSRRWEQHGIVRTVLRMWALRLLYALGVAPRILVRWYE